MNKSLSTPKLLDRLQRLAPEMGGVFSFSDLCNLIGAASEIKNAKVIARLLRDKVLQRAYRGFYIFGKNPDLWALASRIKNESYVSMDSILAKNGLVGTIPAKSVSLVYPGRKVVIKAPLDNSIRYFSIQPDLMFGFSRLKNGVLAADSEKAYLDLLYFYTKGARFVFDPLSEVILRKLDRRKLQRYLKQYKNPKFIKFVKGLLDEVD